MSSLFLVGLLLSLTGLTSGIYLSIYLSIRQAIPHPPPSIFMASSSISIATSRGLPHGGQDRTGQDRAGAGALDLLASASPDEVSEVVHGMGEIHPSEPPSPGHSTSLQIRSIHAWRPGPTALLCSASLSYFFLHHQV